MIYADILLSELLIIHSLNAVGGYRHFGGCGLHALLLDGEDALRVFDRVACKLLIGAETRARDDTSLLSDADV